MIAALFLTLACPLARAEPAPLALERTLRLAREYSPAIAAARSREQASQSRIGQARAGFFPRVDLELIDSAGFPGSSGLTGIGGIMGSPYRSGAGAGLVAQQTVWDFGRTSSDVRGARAERDRREQETRLSELEAQQRAAQAFFECSRSRSLRQSWERLAEEAELIRLETQKFVRTGQRSVVERYLSESQKEEALTAAAEAAASESAATRRIAILTGLEAPAVACPAIEELPALPPAPEERVPEHPLVLASQADALLSRSRHDRAIADTLPRIVAVGSVGKLESSRLVDNQAYAVAVGVVLPLFEGLRSYYRLAETSGELRAREQEARAAEEAVRDLNARYDEVIASSSVASRRLREELELGEKAYATAKERYLGLRGTLVDLREAFRNVSRIRERLIDSQARWLAAQTAKNLANNNSL